MKFSIIWSWVGLIFLAGCSRATPGTTPTVPPATAAASLAPATATTTIIMTATARPLSTATPTPPQATASPGQTATPAGPPISLDSLTGRIVFSAEGDIYTMTADGSGRVQLTNDPAEEFDPVWSPDGTKIAYRSHVNGDAEIYVINADGSDQRNLTEHPADDDWSPAWSPDGKTIAFATIRPEGHGIWLMDADGNNQRPLAMPPGVNDYPTWSPDSQQVAWNCTFGRYLYGRVADFEICVVNADGSGLVQLTDTAGNNKLPAWSPDGSLIAFTSDRNGWPTMPGYTPAGYDAADYGDMEIFVMAADGSNQINLTNHPEEGDDFPAWSRDGRLIFTRYGCLMVLNADGSGLVQVTQGICDEGFPDWFQPSEATSSTPDCVRWIVFVSEQGGQVDLFTVLTDGSGRQQLTNDPAHEQYPVWSPDGSRIAFQRSEPGEETAEIYLMAADGSNLTNLSNDAGDDWTPAWSPDGTQLLFASARDGYPMRLYVGSPDGGEWRPIDHTEGAAMPAWSPDGRRIAYRKELPGNDEIFVVNLDGSGSLNLTNHFSNDFTPSWSPDGQRIVFEASRDGNNEIYGMDDNGANLRRLTESSLDDEYPQWSPDGTVILYTSHGRLYLMDTNGENERPLGRVDGNFASWGPCD